MNIFLILVTTFLIQFIIYLEMNFINPLIPYISSIFNINESSVIYLNIGFSIVGLLVPLLGIWADKYSKKRILIFSMFSFLLGTILCAIAKFPLIFAIGRTFIGLGNFTLNASVISYISDFVPYSKRGKASGFIRIAFALAILLSPIYGTIMSKFSGLKIIYFPLSLLSFIIIILCFMLPETNGNNSAEIQSANIEDFQSMIKNPITLKFLAIEFLIVSSPILTLNYFSIWLKRTFSLNQSEIGVMYTFTALGTVFGVLLYTAISHKLSDVLYSKISFIIMTVSLIFIPYMGSPYTVIPLSFLFAMGLDGGWTAFQTICSEVYPNNRTTFMTLIFFTNSLTFIIFTSLGPTLFEIGGYRLVMGIASLECLISLFIFRNVFNDPTVRKRLKI
ncbi:MFS transporter [Clostridiisalibacter paucivorans]|uniref:MFS transporter n=1 Tax=Clostridiisalibacter paucivorans TaxID=408753 RepID=UPI00047EFAB5|nr:MFS transporter [Clostridiisalibacter paucivorans]